MQVLRQSRVDLVLSDIAMPEMDGLSLRAELNKDPDCQLIPFVFLTASEDVDLCGRAASLGIDDYLVKPVARENLLRCVERVMQRNRQVRRQLTGRIEHKISNSYRTADPEVLPHWRIAIKRRGTGTGGGDILLSQVLADSSLLALIDTMGHDETSKFFSYAYGGYLSGLMNTARDARLDCQEVLRRLSQTAYDDKLLSRTTLTGITLELGPGGQASLACAAHPQPWLVTPGAIASIPVEGVLPGLLPDCDYSPVSISLDPGDRIAIYTDGLIESAADNRSRASLRDAMLEAIRETLNMPIDRAARFIIQLFDDIAGSPPRDDTTFVLLEPDFTR